MALSGAAKAVVGILALLGLLVAAGLGYAAWSLSGAPGSGETVTIDVAQGASASTVADQLADKGVVRSALAFRLKARSRGLDRGLQAGAYELEAGMSVDQAIDRLLAGPTTPATFRFTVPEGLTVEQTLARLAESTPFSVEEYRAVLDGGELSLPGWVPPPDAFGAAVREPYEGLLFPETYELPNDRATPQAVLQRMVDQLVKVVDSVPDEQVAAAAARGFDRYQVLVLASLLEEEARVAEERPTIAGVILNRLQAQRPLEVDASNIYAVGEHTNRVGGEYLKVASPYNLYTNVGLPPTPISAPGRAAIEAAFTPEEHDYLFYVKKDLEGRHAFAATFEEHQRNVARYRELQREQATASPSPASPTPASPSPASSPGPAGG